MIPIEGNIPDITKCNPTLYRLGEYIAFFVESPPSIAESNGMPSGMIEYVYALVIAKEVMPRDMVLIITSERTGGIFKSMTKEAFELDSEEGDEPYLCYFDEFGAHTNLGASNDWKNKDKFLNKALLLAFERLDIPKQPVVRLKDKVRNSDKDILKNGLWDWEGRIGRLKYFLILFTTLLISGLISGVLFFVTTKYAVWKLILVLPLAAIQMLAGIKRFHDLGRSGWYILLSLIPFVNLAAVLYLLFAKGNSSTNEYGPPAIDAPVVEANLNAKDINEPYMGNFEDLVYEQVGKELDSNNPDKGTWTKAFALAGGDDNQTRVLYIKARVEKLTAAEKARLKAIQHKREQLKGSASN